MYLAPGFAVRRRGWWIVPMGVAKNLMQKNLHKPRFRASGGHGLRAGGRALSKLVLSLALC